MIVLFLILTGCGSNPKVPVLKCPPCEEQKQDIIKFPMYEYCEFPTKTVKSGIVMTYYAFDKENFLSLQDNILNMKSCIENAESRIKYMCDNNLIDCEEK